MFVTHVQWVKLPTLRYERSLSVRSHQSFTVQQNTKHNYGSSIMDCYRSICYDILIRNIRICLFLEYKHVAELSNYKVTDMCIYKIRT